MSMDVPIYGMALIIGISIACIIYLKVWGWYDDWKEKKNKT